MAITINGSGTVTGLSVGGLPDGTVDADTLATDSVTAVKIPDTVEADLKSGRKNLIINGGMQVAQRGTSETGVTSSGYKTCDRFIFSRNIGTWTIDQSTDAPDGFSNSLKMTCTTTETPGISSEVGFMYYPEAQDLQHLNYGSSSAKKITISFWVKCSETGDFVLEVLQNDSLRHIGHLVTINSADTWEYKTVTFDGDTSGTINNDNGQGLTIKWWTFIASETYQATGSLQTSWGALDQGGRGYGQTINILDATSDYFAITGVQLELGDTATDFEYRSYGEELALCQRYAVVFANSTSGKSGITMLGSRGHIGLGLAHNSGNPVVYCELPVVMRALPSQTYSSVGHFMFDRGWASTATLTALSIQGLRSSTKSIALIGTTSGLNNGDAGSFDFTNTGGWLLLDAEL